VGESWGDLTFQDASVFLRQPEADDARIRGGRHGRRRTRTRSRVIAEIVKSAVNRGIKVLLIAEDVSPDRAAPASQARRAGVRSLSAARRRPARRDRQDARAARRWPEADVARRDAHEDRHGDRTAWSFRSRALPAERLDDLRGEPCLGACEHRKGQPAAGLPYRPRPAVRLDLDLPRPAAARCRA
jgi:hypothetical protein